MVDRNTDTLLYAARQRRSATFWRLFAICAIFLSIFAFVNSSIDSTKSGPYIARIQISGFMMGDRSVLSAIERLGDNEDVVAVILHIDSPGGTALAGEVYFNTLSQLKKKKPLVTVLETIATSSAYLAAVAADHIISHKATMTGSIGVMIQVPDLSVLADKVGIDVSIVKSGALKGEPALVNPISERGHEMLQGMVNDFHSVFVEMIASARGMTLEDVMKLADGRVFTGGQALKLGLVDAIGGEEQAVAWLQSHKSIAAEMQIRDVELRNIPFFMKQLESYFPINNALIPNVFSSYGMLSLWKKDATIH